MSVSRRRFLRSGAVVSAALVLKPGTFILGQDSLWSNNSHNSNHQAESQVHSYRREMFEPYVGDTFRVRVGKQMVDLKLVALTNVGPASTGITTGKTARTDCFSMRFHAMAPLPANTKIHNLNHTRLGSFDLFMTQSRKGGEFLQTAIVNHVA